MYTTSNLKVSVYMVPKAFPTTLLAPVLGPSWETGSPFAKQYLGTVPVQMYLCHLYGGLSGIDKKENRREKKKQKKTSLEVTNNEGRVADTANYNRIQAVL